jgi:Xaa-Pro aminopeptidase
MTKITDQAIEPEEVRVARLLDAQDKAEQLFDEVGRRGIIVPGARETSASNDIRDLAADLFGVSRYWHKRIVRSGPNTLLPYRENPPDRVIEDDDIAFADFGPIFEAWEADFGRTFVFGDDPVKQRLGEDLARLWVDGREHFRSTPDITGEQLYAAMVQLADDAGWEFGGEIAGHLVGEFPHEKIAGDEIESYIAPGSDQPMRRHDRSGRVCHWILEIHLVDRELQIGGFQEQLLDLGP